jgi:hypothetical protein
MLPFYALFLLLLYFTSANSTDTNKSSSRLIYNSNPDHRLIVFNTKTDRLDKTNHTNNLPLEKSHRRVLKERLKVIITISSISIGIMIVIVSTLIAVKYLRNRTINVPETTEQTIPLNRSN